MAVVNSCSWLVMYCHTAYEQAVRDQQMRTEMSQARKENQFFLSSVEKGKALKRIEERKRKRGEEMDYSTIKRVYKQSKAIPSDGAGPSSSLPDDLLLKVCLQYNLSLYYPNYICDLV